MRILLNLIIFFLVSKNGIAGMYKCIDKQGKVHYGDKPLAECESMDIKPPSVPSEDEVRRSQDRLEKRLEQLRRSEEFRREDEERKKKKKDAKKRQKIEYKKRCIHAQQNLHTLMVKRPVYSINEKGERVYLDDKSRIIEIDRLKKEIETYCK